MEGYIDMHCHILPAVDDGAKNVDDMKEMLKIAYKEGIRCIIATPHCHPKRGRCNPQLLSTRLKELRKAAREIDENFRIYLGSEIFFGQDIIEKIKDKQILTMNRRNYVLIEFSPSETYDYIRQSLQKLQLAGYQVILAHVERYSCLVEDIERAEQLCEMGVYLQINAGSIQGIGNRKIKKYIKNLMERDLIFCVGTDAHDTKRRAPHMKKASEYVRKKYGEEYMRRIFFSNAKIMLKKMEKDEFK